MTNAELIAGLRYCGGKEKYCKLCPSYDICHAEVDGLKQVLLAAADALEAAEKRIAELEADKKTLINVVKDKSDFRATKDAMRIAELEAQLPKDGEWRWNSLLNEYEWVDTTIYCPNCGARMKPDCILEKTGLLRSIEIIAAERCER